MNTELAEEIQRLITSLKLHRTLSVRLLTGESGSLSGELEDLIETGKTLRLAVVMNEAGYTYSLANGERYPFKKIWLIVATGVFPHATTFVRCGGDVQYVEELPLSEQVKETLRKKIRLVGSGIVG